MSKNERTMTPEDRLDKTTSTMDGAAAIVDARLAQLKAGSAAVAVETPKKGLLDWLKRILGGA